MKEAEIDRLLARREGKAPNVLAWIARREQIGCQNPAAAGGTTQRFREVARVQVLKGQARSWRVNLSPLDMLFDAIDPTVGATPTIARVTWGWDDAKFTAEIDWPVPGGHFEVWGDSCEVELAIPATFQTDPALPASNPNTAIAGMAAILPMASVGGPRPTRTVYTGTIAPGGIATVPVPRFARSVRWHQLINLDAAGAAQPIFFGGSQDQALAYITQSTPNDAYTTSERTWPGSDGLTLSPLTQFLTVGNLGGAGDDISLQLEFVIDLG